MIRIAFLSNIVTSITNFSHDDIIVDYFNNSSLVNFSKYQAIILYVDSNKQDINNIIIKITKAYNGIVYVIDKSYDGKRIVELFRYGITDYLKYPIDNNYLMQRILSDYNSKKNILSNVFEYEKMIIHYDKFFFTIAGKFIKLTRVEFLILTKLTRNINKPVSKKEISEAIWNCDINDYRTIETHIKNLRKKLGEYRSNVITIWGYGYAFIPS